jgi:hypothetical protein
VFIPQRISEGKNPFAEILSSCEITCKNQSGFGKASMYDEKVYCKKKKKQAPIFSIVN